MCLLYGILRTSAEPIFLRPFAKSVDVSHAVDGLSKSVGSPHTSIENLVHDFEAPEDKISMRMTKIEIENECMGTTNKKRFIGATNDVGSQTESLLIDES